MADARTTGEESGRCRAATRSGDRCSRAAGEDGFCYQHGPNDKTVDGVTDDEGGREDAMDETDGNNGNNETDESDESDATNETDESDRATESEAADQASESDGGAEASESGGADEDRADSAGVEAEIGIAEAKETVVGVADDLISHPLDGVIEIERTNEGWRVVVEVVERSSIPDTQDILGRYAVELDGAGSVIGYRLTDRYRRGDVKGSPA